MFFSIVWFQEKLDSGRLTPETLAGNGRLLILLGVGK
jgi:hypothetical protein